MKVTYHKCGISLLDSGFRRNDDHADHLVIPAKAGIQIMRNSIMFPYLFRRYRHTS